MSELPHHVERNSIARRLIQRGQRVLVAVSGGVDSMVLLHILHGLAREHKWQLTAAHFNHRLRGRSGDADERLVQRTTRKLGLPVVVEAAYVRGLARARGLSLEMAARELRHDFLARTARRQHITVIAVAHHADDQLELFFLRLLRGSGGEGLSGMKWRNPSPSDARVQLVRPLLDQPKAALVDYAAERGVPYHEDSSNTLFDIQRNRIRHELLPLLRREYQPALDRTIARVMEIVGEEAELAAQAARRWLQSMKRPNAEEDRASLRWLLRMKRRGQDSLPFDDLPVAVQRRCVQMQLLGQGIEPEFELVEQLRCAAGRLVSLRLGQVRTGVQAYVTGTGKMARANPKVDLEKNAWGNCGTPVMRHAIRDQWGIVSLQIAAAQQFSTNSAEVDLEGNAGKMELDGTRVSWRIDSRKAIPQPRGAVQQESFDADKVGSRVHVRHWRPGDRFQPIGMACAVKLQDFFTNQKIPRDRRRQLLVATTVHDDVFWVEGTRISERFKLTQQTNRVLQWRWKRL